MVKILTVYFFALSFVPCGDGGEGLSVILNNQQEVLSSSAADHHQHSNDCGDDDCSPLCVCHCCSIVLYPIAKGYSSIALPGFPKTNPVIAENALRETFLQAIWQPPKFLNILV